MEGPPLKKARSSSPSSCDNGYFLFISLESFENNVFLKLFQNKAKIKFVLYI